MALVRRIAPLLMATVLLNGLAASAPASTFDRCAPRVLVLSAFPGEIDKLLSEASLNAADTQTIDGRNFYVGTLRGNNVVMGLTGIGMNNSTRTARAVIDHFTCESEPSITAVVFSGVSGGRTFIGDVTVPARWTRDNGAHWLPVDAAMLAKANEVKAAAAAKLTSDVPIGDAACVGHDPRLVTTVTVDHTPEIITGGDGQSSDPFGGRTLPCVPGGGDVFGCEPCRAPGDQAADPARFASEAAPFLDPAFFFGYFQSQPSTPPQYDADDMETAGAASVAADAGIPFIAFRALSDGQGDPLMLPGFPFQFFYYRQLAADNAATVALEFLQAWAQE